LLYFKFPSTSRGPITEPKNFRYRGKEPHFVLETTGTGATRKSLDSLGTV